ncbi:MAG: DUF1772 domain-containing protein [Parvibaculaceae bacterium]
MESLLFPLTFLAAIGSGLMAGLFYIFSTVIMRSLDSLPPPQGLAAMKAINITIVNPLFLTIFLGTAVLCVALIILALLKWSGAPSVWLIAGSLIYLAGSIAVTMIFNVPLNNVIEATALDSAQAGAVWARYMAEWVPWNHVRSVACTASLACFIMALRA